MATKKIQIIPPGYTDICYPQTSADMVVLTDSGGNFSSENAEGALAELAGRIVKGTGTLPTTGWDTVTGDYTKRYSFAITGVTANDMVNVIIDKDAHDVAQAADFCSTNECYAGGVYIYAKKVPASAIDFSYIVFK